MRPKRTTPRANIPANTTPIVASSRRPDLRAMSPIASALPIAAIDPPMMTFVFRRNAITTPGKAACEIASPRNARLRRITKIPTLAQTMATMDAATIARITNPYWSGSKRSGMVLVRVVEWAGGTVAAVRLAEHAVVAEKRDVAVGDDPTVQADDAPEVRH